MFQTKVLAQSENLSLFELIKEENIPQIEKNITQYNLKAIGPDGFPPIIAVLFQLIETKNVQARENLTKLIDVLIENGADPFQSDSEGSNTLTWAIISKDEKLIEKFDTLGINAFKRNHFGNSAFHFWLAQHKNLKLKSLQIEVEYQAYKMLNLFAYTLTKLIDKNKKTQQLN